MKRVLKLSIIIVLSLGIVWFLLPLFKLAFGVGCVFGIAVCSAGIFTVVSYKKLCEKGGVKRFAVKLFSSLYVIGMVWCIYLSVLMNFASLKPPPENSDLIVLGALVNKDGSPSKSLAQRINKAYDYMIENPESKCIVTGGQGGNEPMPEGKAQKDILVKKGIDSSRIYVEDKSKNTKENFEYSLKIIEQESFSKDFAVVTQDFHMFRAIKLGESANISVYALPIKSDPMIYPAYYGRELLSLTKWHIQELFGV